MKIIRVQATGTGLILSGLPGLRLVEGELIRASVWERCLFFTTILPDVMFDVMNYCKKIDQQYTLRVIIPNGKQRDTIHRQLC